MPKIKDLQTLSEEELKSKLIDLKKEIMKQNAQIATGTTPKSPGKLRQTKRTVAQILMILAGKVKVPKKEEKKEPAKKQVKNTKEETKKDGRN